jgi:dihydrofolate synthase/folylpolyglutamate synthase
MNYADCLRYLDSLGQEVHGLQWGLETITKVLARLGNPHLKYPTAIIAGTNGKGSTAAMLASILSQAGYRTGLYTSPHLIRVNERMRIDGAEISDDDFARAFTEVRQVVESLLEEKALGQLPSFFEFLTATGFHYFAQAGAGFVVLEVGMGGRLDATNVTQPRVAVITNVGLDHLEFLGSTLADIGREKAGVIKHGAPVVCGCEHGEAAEVIRQRCAEIGAELLETDKFGSLWGLQSLKGHFLFNLSLDADSFSSLTAPLLGRFQVKNAVAAVTAAWRLSRDGFRITRTAIVQGLQSTSWPGRLERVLEHPLVLLDGAHNPAAARALAEFIQEELVGRRLRLVYASMRDKAIGEISEILFPLAEEVYLTRPHLARAATPEEILATAQFRPKRLVIEPEPSVAVARACQASSGEDVVIIIGSLYLVGAVKKALLDGQLQLANHLGLAPDEGLA